MAKKKTILSIEERLQRALVPKEEQPYEVPENWVWVRLGNISDTISKGTTPKGGKAAYTDNGVKFLRIENISDNGTISHDNMVYVNNETHNNFLKRSILQENDVLISIAGTLGKTGIVRKVDLPINTNQAICFVRLKPSVSFPCYIKNVLESPIINDALLSKVKVTSIPNLTLEIIYNCNVPIPPLPEQHRIVSCVEELFAKLDETKENLQEVIDGFETRKAAILHKAFTGELTKKWREEHGVGLESWEIKRFKDVLDVRDGTHDSPVYQEAGFPLITSKNLKNGCIHYNDIKYISKEDYDKINERSKVDINDILFAMIGTIGNPVVVSEEPCFAIKNVALFKSTGRVAPYFVKYYLESKEVKDAMIKDAKGSTQKFVPLGYLRNSMIVLPDESEQQEIVRIVDSLLDKEQKAKQSAESVLEQIDMMKKSILARAFRGELGTNDPAEPSSMELLKQVLAEGQ